MRITSGARGSDFTGFIYAVCSRGTAVWHRKSSFYARRPAADTTHQFWFWRIMTSLWPRIYCRLWPRDHWYPTPIRPWLWPLCVWLRHHRAHPSAPFCRSQDRSSFDHNFRKCGPIFDFFFAGRFPRKVSVYVTAISTFRPRLPSSLRTDSMDYHTDRFFWAGLYRYLFLVSIFPYFSVFGSVRQIKLTTRQFLAHYKSLIPLLYLVRSFEPVSNQLA